MLRNQGEDMKSMTFKTAVFATILALIICAAAFAQNSDRPLTNADVINMVKSKLPESVIVGAVQSHPGKFDTSTNGLIALHNAGVTENELNVMMAASGKGAPNDGMPGAGAPHPANASAAPPSPAGGATATSANSRMPRAQVVQGNSSKELPLEKTQLAQTKTKPSSMKTLAADSAMTQGMQSGINTATYSAANHMNSGIGGASVQSAGSILSGVMSHRSPTATYVWGVPSASSTNILQTSSPTFTVDFSRAPGVNPDDYAPAIVKLTPAQNTCRIIGATQGKEDVRSSPAADWEMYSHFLEEPVATRPEKLGTGKYKIASASELLPGEYGLVLRPISKSKKFSGGDVARSQGDGLMFNTVWTFQISTDAQ
jgi:hypothetical protein